ncbi:reverse transcriptase domain-containing protein [Tanacetum coccineum]
MPCPCDLRGVGIAENIDSSSNSKGITAIVNKLDSLGRDMKKLKENVHAIQVGCQTCRGTHLDKECPLNEEVKSVEEESTRRRAEMEEWVKKLQENAEINTRSQSTSLKNLETQIKQLTKEFHAKTASEVNNSSFDQCKAVYADKEAPLNNAINEPREVSFVQEEGVSSKVLPCQLPPKELNPRNFIPCTIGSLNIYAMADLGASINVIPKSMFEHLKLARLKKTDMLVEMVDMTKRAPIGIVENVLVKIDKFLFPSDLWL